MRIISLNQALAQGETLGSIEALIKWHRYAAEASGKAKRRRHEETILALLCLKHALAETSLDGSSTAD